MVMISIGVSIKGSDLYLAAITYSKEEGHYRSALPGSFGKLSPSTNLAGEVQLLDTKKRIGADIREWDATAVTLLDTAKYSQWTYSHAQNRILSIGALMIACAEEAVIYNVVKPSAVGRAVSSPKLDSIDPQIFGFTEKPTYWSAGLGEAFAVASVCLQQISSKPMGG